MAAFNHLKNMYDVAFKPRLLRTLIKGHVPDDKQPFGNPAGLSTVVSTIKTHRLLSESSFGESTDQRLIESWESAVDSWVERLLLLVSHNMPDKCWAGICLLGLTCQECSSDRFLASYTLWFNKLLLYIQSSADSQFVKLASCATLSDMFTRLGAFSNIKKDGTSHAGKLVQPVLKLLNDSSEAIWEGALQLLCTIITHFPSSIHRHYDSVETAIASKMLSGKCSVDMRMRLAHSLALLPKSRGNEESWSLMMQKILLLINCHLNGAFQGLEEEAKRNEAIRFLVPPGKDPPPPLGGCTLTAETLDNPTGRPEQLWVSIVSSLMLCCSIMLTSRYAVQVTVPIRSLSILIERVLMVDGSLPHALLPFMTSMQQELLCSELPVLHSYSLELLGAIIRGTRSQLLPHAASIVRLIIAYFKRCGLPELRIKVYSITRTLLMSMGVGMGVYLAQEVINNAFVDLNAIDSENDCTYASANSKVSSEALLQPCHKKRKLVDPTGNLEKQHEHEGLKVGSTKNQAISPISVRIAALEALETLFIVVGGMRAEYWRSNIDVLLIGAATNALEGGWANEDKNILQSNEPITIWVDFQLAALRALLASLLSSVHARPPYLAQGLELFRRGRKEIGTKLSEFCAHALLALEVLIHPKALPLVDYSSASCNHFEGVNHKFSENLYSGSLMQGGQFNSNMHGRRDNIQDSEADELYDTWLDNSKETKVQDSIPPDNMRYNEERFEIVGASSGKNHYLDGSSSERIRETREKELGAHIVDVRLGGNNDEIRVDMDQSNVNIGQVQELVTLEGATVPATEKESGRFDPGIGASDHASTALAQGQDVSKSNNEFTFTGMDTNATTSISEKIDGDALELDGEDPFPEIIDVEPESDDE